MPKFFQKLIWLWRGNQNATQPQMVANIKPEPESVWPKGASDTRGEDLMLDEYEAEQDGDSDEDTVKYTDLEALRAHLRAETRDKGDPELQCTMSACEDCGMPSRTGVCEKCLRLRIHAQMAKDACAAGRMDALYDELCPACGRISHTGLRSWSGNLQIIQDESWRDVWICEDCLDSVNRFVNGVTYPKHEHAVTIATDSQSLLQDLIMWLAGRPKAEAVVTKVTMHASEPAEAVMLRCREIIEDCEGQDEDDYLG